MIGVLDYGVGNVDAFLRIYRNLNIDAIPVSTPEALKSVDGAILPGVGAFDVAMSRFNQSGLRPILEKRLSDNDLHLLCVCIGMHMLADESDEGLLPGLCVVPGSVRRIESAGVAAEPLLLPHMGWNSVTPCNEKGNIWDDIKVDQGFYFLHSYKFECNSEDSVLATSSYGSRFVSAIKKFKVYGFQFHPEKSGENGLRLLENFANEIRT